MYIKVNVKQLGSRRKIDKQNFYLENKPKTVRDFIIESVKTCVDAYNKRVDMTEAKPLSDFDIEAGIEIGKIAFGFNYGGKKADLNTAIDNAIQSYSDGLYRIFIDDEEVKGLDADVTIDDQTVITFIKLVMLTGRLW